MGACFCYGKRIRKGLFQGVFNIKQMRHDKINYHEVVNRLIGPIDPVGSSDKDEVRFENLEAMCKLVTKLVQGIDRVYYENKGRSEHSIKKAADFAKNFLTNDLGIK